MKSTLPKNLRKLFRSGIEFAFLLIIYIYPPQACYKFPIVLYSSPLCIREGIEGWVRNKPKLLHTSRNTGYPSPLAEHNNSDIEALLIPVWPKERMESVKFK